MRIIINGVGVAGPALAYWLTKSGHEVTLVEEAPELRSGGYIVDFWGLGYDIAEKMGLIGEIRDLGYRMKEVRFVGPHGRKKGGFGVEVFGRLTNDRFTSVKRSDISATIYRALGGNVKTMFGDSVGSIEEHADCVRVGFDHAPARDADLVIGADGLHSRVRRLVFGPEKNFEYSLGYHVAAFEAVGYPHRDDLVYVSHGLPGRQISRFTMREDKTLFLFVFRDEHMSGQSDPKAIIERVFDGAGWEWPQIREAMHRAAGFYFDTVSQIRMDRWTRGRTALIGDAGACVSLMAGEGTGLAITEAYVLAGELHAAGSDFGAAFARYEQRLMPFLRRKQQSAAKFATSFAPRTAFGVEFRNVATRLMSVPFVAEYFIGRDLRDDIALPEYSWT